MTKTPEEEQDTELGPIGADTPPAPPAEQPMEAPIPEPTLLDPEPEMCEAPIIPPSERTDEVPVVDQPTAELIVRSGDEQLQLDEDVVRGGLGPRGRNLPEPKGMFELGPWGLWTIVGLAAIYLGNFTMGVDIIPDNIPIVGNADEVVAFFVGQQAYVAIRWGKSYLFKLKKAVDDTLGTSSDGS